MQIPHIPAPAETALATNSDTAAPETAGAEFEALVTSLEDADIAAQTPTEDPDQTLEIETDSPESVSETAEDSPLPETDIAALKPAEPGVGDTKSKHAPDDIKQPVPVLAQPASGAPTPAPGATAAQPSLPPDTLPPAHSAQPAAQISADNTAKQPLTAEKPVGEGAMSTASAAQAASLSKPVAQLDTSVQPIDTAQTGGEIAGRADSAPDSGSARTAEPQRLMGLPAHGAQLSTAGLRQIAEMLQTRPDAPVEITMSPEELGRVRISLIHGDGGLSISVLADEAQTLELFRRHADELQQELAAMGFAGATLDFGQNGQSNGPSDSQMNSTTEFETPEAALLVDLDRLPQDGLDIRL